MDILLLLLLYYYEMNETQHKVGAAVLHECPEPCIRALMNAMAVMTVMSILNISDNTVVSV